MPKKNKKNLLLKIKHEPNKHFVKKKINLLLMKTISNLLNKIKKPKKN